MHSGSSIKLHYCLTFEVSEGATWRPKANLGAGFGVHLEKFFCLYMWPSLHLLRRMQLILYLIRLVLNTNL